MVFYVADFNYKHVERKLIIIKTINIKRYKKFRESWHYFSLLIGG